MLEEIANSYQVVFHCLTLSWTECDFYLMLSSVVLLSLSGASLSRLKFRYKALWLRMNGSFRQGILHSGLGSGLSVPQFHCV